MNKRKWRKLKVSRRLKNWDYRSSAPYFVTIVTKNHNKYFGEIKNGEIILNDLGKFVVKCFDGINLHMKHVNVVIYTVMPDHVHAIIELHNNYLNLKPNKFGPLIKKSLSSLINHFKGRVTNYANKYSYKFEWQDDFDDRIIRNPKSYKRIYKYIRDNPKKWKG